MFQVAELVTSEFFEQGDRERSELKLTPSVSPFFISLICNYTCCFCFGAGGHTLSKLGLTGTTTWASHIHRLNTEPDPPKQHFQK